MSRAAIIIAAVAAYLWLSIGLAFGLAIEWRHEKACGTEPSPWLMPRVMVVWPFAVGAGLVLMAVGEEVPAGPHCKAVTP